MGGGGSISLRVGSSGAREALSPSTSVVVDAGDFVVACAASSKVTASCVSNAATSVVFLDSGADEVATLPNCSKPRAEDALWITTQLSVISSNLKTTPVENFRYIQLDLFGTSFIGLRALGAGEITNAHAGAETPAEGSVCSSVAPMAVDDESTLTESTARPVQYHPQSGLHQPY